MTVNYDNIQFVVDPEYSSSMSNIQFLEFIQKNTNSDIRSCHFKSKFSNNFKTINNLIQEFKIVDPKIREYGNLSFTILSDNILFIGAGYGNHMQQFTIYTTNQSIIDYASTKYQYVMDTMESSVDWYFRGAHDELKSIPIAIQSGEIHDEFYPQMAEGVRQFFDEYIKDDATVIIMFGEPGTGKTSLLRHFIHHYNRSAIVTYDETILADDGFFVDYMTHRSRNLLIVEDADLLIQSRESGNKMMSKFLNISDGLVKFANKKIIFTTNLTSINKVDEALIREGRCFGTIQFSPLTYEQTVAACKAANLSIPTKVKSYTLAEMFNRHKRDSAVVKKVGII